MDSRVDERTDERKALVVCTVACFLTFELNDIRILRNLGYKVYVATNFNTYEEQHEKVKEAGVPLECQYQVDFTRSPFTPQIMKAYRQLKEIVFTGQFDLIHCHTPVGGVITRLVVKKYNESANRHNHRIQEGHNSNYTKISPAKVIYTAHGFHFYDGAPLKNWVMFYPIEKYLSKYTDVLITINKEDYKRASEHFFAKKVVYVPGVGVDTKKFANVASTMNREEKRKELGVKDTDIMLLSVGELNTNKNHCAVIKALGHLRCRGNAQNVKYMIAGRGDQADALNAIALEEGVDLKLLGYRHDISELMTACDFYILPSLREGLNVSLMEAMASGTPCLCGKIRGNVDLIDAGKGGELFEPTSVESIADAIRKELELSAEQLTAQGQYNLQKINQFDLTLVGRTAENLYGGGNRENNEHVITEEKVSLTDYKYLMEVIERQKKREDIGLKTQDYVMISVGELSKRKNQIVVLEALSRIKASYPEIFDHLQYIIVGSGDKLADYTEYCQTHGIEDHVFFLGYRHDISDLLHACDLFVFPSLQEGLPVALMEAISSGIGVICSSIRGNTDLVERGLFEASDVDALEKLIIDKLDRKRRVSNVQHIAMDDYTVDSVQKKMRQVYALGLK